MKKIGLLIIFLFSFYLKMGAQSFTWAKSMSGPGDDKCLSMCIDDSGNVYTTGYFEGICDFDPGVGVFNLTSLGADDIFVCKFNSNGNFVWALSMGSTLDDHGNSIEIDSNGHLYLTGFFTALCDFDPSPNISNLNTNGLSDIFVCKLSTTGAFIWARSFGGNFNDGSSSISVDHFGNSYSTGYFQNTCDFDPGMNIQNVISNGQKDIFISKLDSNGNFVWAKTFGANNDDIGIALKVDQSGNIYTTGTFWDTTDFDPGPNVNNLIENGSGDIFILKLDASGNFVWVAQFSSNGQERPASIVIDQLGNVLTTGRLQPSTDFDPGPNTFILPLGTIEVFISKLDSNANFLWAKAIGSDNYEYEGSIDVDANGNIYTTGGFKFTADFDPGLGVYNLVTPNFNHDIFISKLDLDGNFVWAKRIGSSEADKGHSIKVDNGGNIFCAGYFGSTVDFNPNLAINNLTSSGAADIFVLKLSPCVDPNTSTANVLGCGSYYLSGHIYDTNGTFIQTLQSTTGCDSTITLNVTIGNSTSETLTQTACKNFILNGQTYNSTGTYLQNLINVSGCDSFLTLNLTIYNVNTTLSQSGATLVAYANGATYQWISCNPFQVISGETNQSFTATAIGDYACVVTKNGCTDTSTCYTVNSVGIENYDLNRQVSIHPNPSQGKFFLYKNSAFTDAEISISNQLGKTIFCVSHLKGKEFGFDISEYQAGLYFVKIKDGNQFKVFKILKL